MNTAALNTILAIDDDKVIRDNIAAYLEDCNYEVRTAVNGREGMALFDASTPELVLVDLRMPEIDGLTVLKHIKSKSPDTPVIVVSGTGLISDTVEALRKGAWDYLMKPIPDMSVLLHAVEKALEKSRLLRDNRDYQQNLEQMVAARTKALQKANLSLSQINDRLRSILETTRHVSAATEIQDFGVRLLKAFSQHMGAAGGSFYRVANGGLQLMNTLDPSHAPVFIPFPLSPGSVFERAMESRQPVLISDIDSEEGLKPSGYKGYANTSVLVFPLLDEYGETAAILSLHDRLTPPFVEQDKKIGQIIASFGCEALRVVGAVKKMRDREERFKNILDSIQAGILVLEPESHEIVYANPMIAQMLGRSRPDLIGAAGTGFYCEESGSPVARPGSRLTGEIYEATLLQPDGSPLWVLKSTSEIIFDERRCILETFIDISDRKRAEIENNQLERQLRQAQNMEAIGTLAGGIAHDFNNILGSLLGYAELCLMQVGKDTALRDKLQIMHQSIIRATDLVKQILTFSRRAEHARVQMKVHLVLKEALKLLRPTIPATIEIREHIGTKAAIMGDPVQIHQVIMNLSTNAFHAMEDSGGVLDVSLAEVNVSATTSDARKEAAPGRYLQLSVKDSGHGIPSAIMEKIFDPYFTTKESGRGTGLGLAVTHGIVKSHGGFILVDSEVNAGTTFNIYLPVVDEVQSETKEAVPRITGGKEPVLLVDDEAELLAITHQMLESLGYRVTTCNRGMDALALFESTPHGFDLVITDMTMPGMTGEHLSERILEIRPDMPIILCTGYAEGMDATRAEMMGIKKFFMKPVSLAALANAIRELLDNVGKESK